MSYIRHMTLTSEAIRSRTMKGSVSMSSFMLSPVSFAFSFARCALLNPTSLLCLCHVPLSVTSLLVRYCPCRAPCILSSLLRIVLHGACYCRQAAHNNAVQHSRCTTLDCRHKNIVYCASHTQGMTVGNAQLKRVKCFHNISAQVK